MMLRIFTTIGAIQVISILSSLIRTKYIAITLGPEGTGIIGIVDQVVQLTSFISAFSLPLASIKYLSKANSEDFETFKKAYASFLNLLLFISIFASISLFLIVSSSIELPLGEINQYRDYLYIALLGLPAMILGGFLSNVMASDEKPNSAAMVSLTYSLSLTVAVLIGIAIADITGYYWASAISGTLITVSVIIYIRLKLKLPVFIRNLHPVTMLKEQPEILRFSVFLFFASVTHSFSLFAARYSILDHQGVSAAGLLHALLAIAIAVDMVLTPINGFFLTPKLNRNIDNLEKIRFTMDFQKIQLLCMTAIVLPFALYPNLTILILFSEKFTTVAPYLFVFLIGQFLGQMGGVYQSLLIGFDKTKMFSIITCTCWLSFAAFSWIMVPLWGYWGIGIGFLLSRLLLLVWSLGYLRAKYPIKIPTKIMLLSIYCLTLISIVGYFASNYNDLDWTIFTVKMLIYLVAISALYLFLTHQEKLNLSKQIRWFPAPK